MITRDGCGGRDAGTRHVGRGGNWMKPRSETTEWGQGCDSTRTRRLRVSAEPSVLGCSIVERTGREESRAEHLTADAMELLHRLSRKCISNQFFVEARTGNPFARPLSRHSLRVVALLVRVHERERENAAHSRSHPQKVGAQ